MDSFGHILNWRLKHGSHTFPGQDGGTCINEAAIVAAGFPYQPVRSVEDMPACFSRPICRLAMRLNDQADDEQGRSAALRDPLGLCRHADCGTGAGSLHRLAHEMASPVSGGFSRFWRGAGHRTAG